MTQLVERQAGDQWVADSSLNAGGHCVVSLSKTLYPFHSTGSTQDDLSQHDCKIVDWDVKNHMAY